MTTNFIDAIENTISFMQTSIGIFIFILIAIIIAESLIIWLLIWIIKNQFNKSSQKSDGGIQIR